MRKEAEKKKDSDEEESEAEEEEKEEKKPSFLQQTLSGRTPKATSRYEGKPEQPPIKKPKEEPATKNNLLKPKVPPVENQDIGSFEKSVLGLEEDLKKLPSQRQKLSTADRLRQQHLSSKKPKQEITDDLPDETKVKEEESESEEEEEGYQLTEWFPPDLCNFNEKVIVTDVTVDNFTVTMRECKTPEGFFRQPLSQV